MAPFLPMPLLINGTIACGKPLWQTLEVDREGWLDMRRTTCVLILVLACGMANLTIPIASYSSGTAERTVKGTVMAINTAVDPRTIVVNVVLPNKEELIVGARVPEDARIVRGNQAARLDDVKVGETATITYLKTTDGLIVRSIHLR